MISDTVEFSPKQFNIPKMSSTDATIHATQDLIYALQDPAPDSSSVKLVNTHNESFIEIAYIFRKETPSAVPTRVPVRGGFKKLQQVNQERTHMKNAFQSKTFTNIEPLRVPILGSYPEELQPVHPEKPKTFFSTRQKFSSYTKIKENYQKYISDWKEQVHKSTILDQAL